MTETQSTDLAAWLTAIWDEEERLARAAVSPARRHLAADSGVWGTFHGGGIEDAASGDVIVYDEGAPTSEQADFIAAHDPASVLARIAADRKILELHKPQWNDSPHVDNDFYGCLTCYEADLCDTLKVLASPHRGREGWREEWE